MNVKTIKPFGKGLADEALKISLCDQNPEIAAQLAQAFESVKSVEVVCGNILHLNADALVSPANSFGDMSGGIDKAIDDFYAQKAQKLIQSTITHHFLGELPVGMAIVVQLDNPQFPNLICAPTMRVPGNIKDSIHAYLAMRAILVAIIQWNRQNPAIRSVAIPSLGTGVGGMYYEMAAEQMRTAYETIINEQWRNVAHPIMAPYAGQKKWSFKKED